jgi:hypothetical protein
LTPLQWKQHDKYALVSDCGRYAVCKFGSTTGIGQPTYEPWRRVAHPLGRLQLAVGLSRASSAQAICEHDHAITSAAV